MQSIKKFIYTYTLPFLLFIFIFLFVLLVSTQASNISVDVVIFDMLEHTLDDIEITPKEGFVILDITGTGSVEESTPHFILHLQNGLFMVDIYGTGEQDIFMSYIVANEGSPAAIVYGLIGTTIPVAIDILKNNFKDIKFLVLYDVWGGAHVTAIIEAMKIINDHGYGTYITENSVVESAGIDIFAAGYIRYAEEGATVGVHDFIAMGADEGEVQSQELASATDMQELLKKFGIKDTFYTFMRSISAENMYYLSYQQMKQYNLINVAEESEFNEKMGVQKQRQ